VQSSSDSGPAPIVARPCQPFLDRDRVGLHSI
jgi:hypothetical protein